MRTTLDLDDGLVESLAARNPGVPRTEAIERAERLPGTQGCDQFNVFSARSAPADSASTATSPVVASDLLAP